VPVINL